ncbi:MAG: hypothetical protein IPG00_02365 [Saprospiraceae bacterium]|nr:hypothetical protein [Saprospiraceae bacterium]
MGNEDNTGLASHFSLTHQSKLDSSGLWNLSANVKHEFVHKNFRSLNPYRVPEFV